MSGSKTLTLRPGPSIDPKKIALSQDLGFRFIDKRGRYILQMRTVIYPTAVSEVDRMPMLGRPEHTWVDIPLVPEAYA